jgi:hypothetical protein
MGGDLVKRAQSLDLLGEDFDRVERIAAGLAKSGVFKDVPSTQNAMAKILIGADLGLTPTQALMNIDVVEGNARVRSNQLAAWVRQHDDYDYKVVEHDADHCAIEFFYKGEAEGRSEYSIADAKSAGLVKDHPKAAWNAHPKNMLFARAMSNGVKWYCPDLTGGVAVYTEADVFESTAVEIGAGEGDGTPPGWQLKDPAQVEQIEELMRRAEAAGFPALADVATVQMRLNHQAPEAVAEWIAAGDEQVSVVEAAKAEAERAEETS